MKNLFTLSGKNAAMGNSSVSQDNRTTYTQLSEKSLYKAISADKLLASIRRQELLKAIKEIAAPLPDEYYDTIYLALIRSFVSFVQILPTNNEARLASIMDEGLLRALYALQVWQKSSKEEVDLVLSYVVFSALLLFDIACVVEKRTVIISGEDGSFKNVWDPYHDGAIAEGEYYKVRRGAGLTPWSSRRSVIGLAINLMPEAGFNWIYKNSHAFNIWLALLADDKEGAGALRFAFDKALEMLKENPPELYAPLDIKGEVILETKNDDAEDFIRWIKNETVNGKLKADSPGGDVYYLGREHVLISQALMEKYLRVATGRPLSFLPVLMRQLTAIGAVSSSDSSAYSYGQQRQAALSSSLFSRAAAPPASSSSHHNSGTFKAYSLTAEAREWLPLPSADKNSPAIGVAPVNKADRVSTVQQQLQSLNASVSSAGAKDTNAPEPQRITPNSFVRY